MEQLCFCEYKHIWEFFSKQQRSSGIDSVFNLKLNNASKMKVSFLRMESLRHLKSRSANVFFLTLCKVFFFFLLSHANFSISNLVITVLTTPKCPTIYFVFTATKTKKLTDKSNFRKSDIGFPKLDNQNFLRNFNFVHPN